MIMIFNVLNTVMYFEDVEGAQKLIWTGIYVICGPQLGQMLFTV